MERQKAIELLKQKRNEAADVASLPYRNNEFIPWRRNIEDILEAAFGTASTEYKRVKDVQSTVTKGTKSELQRVYVRLVHRIQLEVNSIIQKYEILEIEEKPAEKTEKKDTAKLPIQIFDAVQFHPRVVEVSKSCFIAGNYREAILNAFIRFIDYVKEITGLDLDGDDLMNQAFSFNYDKEHEKITKYPKIRINKLENSNDRSEQQGFMYLCKGAAMGIRNPKAHKIILQSNPLHTLEYLAFASLLMRIIEQSPRVKTRPTKINEDTFIARCREGRHERAIDLYLKAKELKENRSTNGDFINWGVSGYSYRMPWKTCPNGETLFIAYRDGKLQIWPDILRKRSSGEVGKIYWENLRSIPGLARKFSSVTKYNYPTISTDNMKKTDIDAFIKAIQELGDGLDNISK